MPARSAQESRNATAGIATGRHLRPGDRHQIDAGQCNPSLSHLQLRGCIWKSEKTVGIEYIKWAFIAALIWFSLYQIALAIGITPVF